MDFRGPWWLSAAMDKATFALVAELCARAGMIMEDTSVAALTIGAAEADVASTLDQIERAVDQMSKLIAAARSLAR